MARPCSPAEDLLRSVLMPGLICHISVATYRCTLLGFICCVTRQEWIRTVVVQCCICWLMSSDITLLV